MPAGGTCAGGGGPECQRDGHPASFLHGEGLPTRLQEEEENKEDFNHDHKFWRVSDGGGSVSGGAGSGGGCLALGYSVRWVMVLITDGYMHLGDVL